MKAGSREPVLSHRLGRFLRWFFNASPDAVELPPPRLPARRSATLSHHQPPRVVARHRGPVRVAVKGKS
jgi:hypothetical protein